MSQTVTQGTKQAITVQLFCHILWCMNELFVKLPDVDVTPLVTWFYKLSMPLKTEDELFVTDQQILPNCIAV